jgi:hypothetical protein
MADTTVPTKCDLGVLQREIDAATAAHAKAASRCAMTRATSSGRPAANPDDAPTPTDETVGDGQKADHWVLSAEDRAKGFVRPVRASYRHVGAPGPRHPLRGLTAEERARFGDYYVKYEEYPKPDPDGTGKRGARGRFWTQDRLDRIGKGCGAVTSMPRAIAETYAAQPGYYGSTWCCGCRAYLPVGEKDGEFVWTGDGGRVGA